MQESTNKVRQFASQVVRSRIRLTLHATCRTLQGASRLVHAMSAWSAKTRHAPSRHCREARVYTLWSYHYGQAQTEYTPPRPPLPHSSMALPLLVVDALQLITSHSKSSAVPHHKKSILGKMTSAIRRKRNHDRGIQT